MYGRECPSPQLVLKGIGGFWSRWSGRDSFMPSLHTQNICANCRVVAENNKQLPLLCIKCFKRAGTKSTLFTAESPTTHTYVVARAHYAVFESMNVRHAAKHVTLSHFILSIWWLVLSSIYSRCDSGGSEVKQLGSDGVGTGIQARVTPAYVARRQPRGAVAPSAACAAPSGSPLAGGGGRTVTAVK